MLSTSLIKMFIHGRWGSDETDGKYFVFKFGNWEMDNLSYGDCGKALARKVFCM